MKKLTAILLGTLIASSAALAQTQVLSRNAVGYIKINLASNSLNLVSDPFFRLDGVAEPRLTNVFSVVPGNTVISIWNEQKLPIPGYDTYSRNRSGVWLGGATTATVKRADGIFVRIAQTNGVDLFFMGEVPDRISAPSNFMSRIPGITMVGNPYPVTIRLTNTVMAQQLPPNTVVSVWNPQITNYVNYSKNRLGVWLAAAQTAELFPGQGIVINSTNVANSWYETKPYTWP